MSTEHRLLALDALRGVAAICVLMLHALVVIGRNAAMPHAHLAVDFFFMLSAFVIAHAYGARVKGGMTVTRFLLTRWVRLYPLYFVGLTLGLAVFALKTRGSTTVWESSAVLQVLLPAIFFLPSEAMLAPGWTAGFPLNNPSWSLFFEWIANLAWVVVLVRLPRRYLELLLLFAAGAEVVQAFYAGQVDGGSTYETLPLGIARVCFPFLVGLVIHDRFKRAVPLRVAKANDGARLVVLATGLVGVLVLPIGLQGGSRALYEVGTVCIVFPCLLMVALQTTVAARWRPFAGWLGRVSYPIYVLHFPLLRMFSNSTSRRLVGETWLPALVLGEIVLVLLISHLLMKLWDEPVRGYLTSRFLPDERPRVL